MRCGLLLGGLLALAGAVYAQPPAPYAPVAPITDLGTTLDTVRSQTSAISELLTDDKLTDPVILHSIAALLDSTALTVDEMATHAEHGQITAEQRALIQARVDRVQFQLNQLRDLLQNRQLR